MRPHVTVNCAASIDGKIASFKRTQTPISSAEDLERVKRLRAACDAILVGVGTVLADDPHLHAQTHQGKPLLRVVVDSKGRTPPGAHVVDGVAPTLVVTNDTAKTTYAKAEVVRVGDGRVDLGALLEHLHDKRGVRKLLVEGGGEVIHSFLAEGLVDDFYLFVADFVLGGRDAPTVADGDGHIDPTSAPQARFVSAQRMEGGLLLHYRFGDPK